MTECRRDRTSRHRKRKRYDEEAKIREQEEVEYRRERRKEALVGLENTMKDVTRCKVISFNGVAS